jgi:flagellar motor component MotA
MEAINITAYPSDTSQVEAIKAVMKAFKIKFEIKKEKPYKPEYVAKIKKSRQEYKDGNFVTVEKKNLKSFLGLE